MNRVSHLLSQLEKEYNTQQLRISNTASYAPPIGDDIVLVNGIRTAICKSKRGKFKDTAPIQLLAPVLKYVTKDLPNAAIIDDICVGTVLAPGGLRASECRMAQFIAGIPQTTTLRTVNRQCSSGLQAIIDIAANIKAGYIQIGIGAGLESMTANSFGPKNAKAISIPDEVKMNMEAMNCMLPMGITSENVAAKYNISRLEQDEFSVLSQTRAAKARDSVFADEILPIITRFRDKNTGKWSMITVEKDDGIRPSTVEGLSKLRAVFKKGGTTTAGNSSQTSDGAAAVLIMKRSRAKQLGLQPMGRLIAYAVAGVPPHIMGVGPAYAIPKVLKQAGMTLEDIDLFEINEAFASQAIYCVRELGLSMSKVNVNGGAIAFGHPLGCTGTRMTVTLLKEMERRGLKRGIVSMCIGSGMGAAAIFERI